jgi:predicted transport protein
MPYVPHRRLMLKSHPEYNEKWLQQHIADDPGLLGLGDLDVKDMERSQPRAGRLDLLLFDAEANTRYEVELQLGATDESHIIRTIEYWDIERRRYPQYDHVGVIVAEEITARFFNVVSLFNGFIPLIAIQLNAIEVAGAVTLVFTTVLDRMPLGLDEEDEAEEPRDRLYWERRASTSTLELTDRILRLVQSIEPRATLKYNKNYIGIARDGTASNFVSFRPRRQHVLMELKIPRSEELTERIETSGIEVLTYQTRWGQYRVSLTAEDVEANEALLAELIGQAHENYGL